MRRKTFDALMVTAGLLIAALLLVGGGLLTWAHSFVNDQVRSQLSQQQIYFPQKGSQAISDPLIAPYLNKYAGQQLLNGAQAEAYADHFIKVHLEKIGGGKTYAQLPQDDPTRDTVMTASFLRASLFTSVVAFGVSALVAGLGLLFVLLGLAMLGILKALPAVQVASTGPPVVEAPPPPAPDEEVPPQGMA
jgi:hypothetical protein